jgi:ABC-type dipeptide/oligopeptide/nickel transport system permease subunit
MEVSLDGVDTTDDAALLEIWKANYDESAKPKGMTKSERNACKRLNSDLNSSGKESPLKVASEDESVKIKDIDPMNYVPVNQVRSVIRLPLGTDNFGRDVLKELVSAIGTSLLIGLVAGVIATLIGLVFGLLSGYVGGTCDDIIMFITNIFTVIPSFILLILINYSLGQEARGPMIVAVVIGLTSWTWTTRSVRSQVISLRNRDHVNLSKLSGHSLFRIVTTDILPYIASYVVMAFILQVSSGILAEAQLSLLGLGPRTTDVPTLGLMMNWAKLFGAYTSSNAWWAYFPVIGTIALISFSLNLMNTGLDQVFNPALRD